MDSSKMSKLLDYAKLLAKEGESLEKDGEEEEAVPKYIKVVDILLILADAAPTYPAWTDYINKAEFYQKRTKILLAKISMKRDAASAEPEKAPVPSPSQISRS